LNELKGNRGPGIVAIGMFALTIQSNYFEGNNSPVRFGLGLASYYNLSFINPHQQIPVAQDILLGVSITNYPWVAWCSVCAMDSSTNHNPHACHACWQRARI
jgi:hypothetical protein